MNHARRAVVGRLFHRFYSFVPGLTTWGKGTLLYGEQMVPRGDALSLSDASPLDFMMGTGHRAIDPEKFDIIGIKAAVAHRQAYDPIARASCPAATLGPCSSDLCLL